MVVVVVVIAENDTICVVVKGYMAPLSARVANPLLSDAVKGMDATSTIDSRRARYDSWGGGRSRKRRCSRRSRIVPNELSVSHQASHRGDCLVARLLQGPKDGCPTPNLALNNHVKWQSVRKNASGCGQRTICWWISEEGQRNRIKHCSLRDV